MEKILVDTYLVFYIYMFMFIPICKVLFVSPTFIFIYGVCLLDKISHRKVKREERKVLVTSEAATRWS